MEVRVIRVMRVIRVIRRIRVVRVRLVRWTEGYADNHVVTLDVTQHSRGAGRQERQTRQTRQTQHPHTREQTELKREGGTRQAR